LFLFSIVPVPWNTEDFRNGLTPIIRRVSGLNFVWDCAHWVDSMPWMALVELVNLQGSHQVYVVPLITKCDLFKNIRVWRLL
jgi:hypothetical protein